MDEAGGSRWTPLTGVLPAASQWEAFPAPVQQILEQALMESTARTAIPMPGGWGPCAVYLLI